MTTFYSSLINRIKLYAFSKLGFWSGRLYDINVQGESASGAAVFAESTTTKWAVIVGRDYYFESVKDYPIGVRSDLNGVLKNEVLTLPYDGIHFHRIERLSEKSHRVTSWLIKHSVLEALPTRPYLLIPETSCFDLSEAGDGLLLDRLGQLVYINVTADGIVSRLHQAESEGDGSVHEKILNSLGVADRNSWVRLSEPQTVRDLCSGFVRLLLRSPLTFKVDLNVPSAPELPWKKGAVLIAASLSLYLLVSSMYLVARESWLDYSLLASRDQVESAMNSRRLLGEVEALNQSLSSITANEFPYWVAWPIFLDLVSLDNIMVANRTSKEGVTFIGRAENAASTLDIIKNDPRVASAEFALPVRVVSNLEAYTIDVVLNDVLDDSLVSIGEPVQVLESKAGLVPESPLQVEVQ